MNATNKSTRIISRLVLSSGIAVAGMGLAAGTAHANGGPFTWCPGQSMASPEGPNVANFGDDYRWDMNVCHTYYRVTWGYGNVPQMFDSGPSLSGSSIWDGDNPPGPNPSGVNCGLFFCPVPPHPDPNFHA